MDERIAALTAQIEKLQAENTFLKRLLDEDLQVPSGNRG